MEILFHKLGIDWKLLLSQSVNFLLLLTALHIFAYKPIVKLMKDRQARIEEGLAKADEASRRLDEANAAMKTKMQEAEQESLVILKQTEEKARKTEARMLDDARKKENEMMKNAELLAAAKQEEARKAVEQEAIGLVKSAIAKTVELAPEAVDEALIKKAIREVKGII